MSRGSEAWSGVETAGERQEGEVLHGALVWPANSRGRLNFYGKE